MFCIALTDDMRRHHERMLREAIRQSGQTLDQASREADTDSKQFAREIALVTGTLRRLAKQGPAFWQWWAVGLAAHFGLPTEVKQAYRLHRRSKSFTRMARMALRQQVQHRKAS